MRRFIQFCFPLLGAALLLATPVQASGSLLTAVEVNRAVNVVETLHTQLANLMLSDETELEARKALIGPTLRGSFDLEAMTKAVIGGRTWRGAQPDEQNQAIEAFSNWMVTQYASRFTTSSDPEFLTRETRDGGLNTVVIETQLRTKKKSVGLDYRMRAAGDAMKIIDVFLDGRVSEVALRKSEFRGTIKEDGVAGFIAAVEAKTQALQ
jgi:phospholipid transport system substrate-binding protein